MKFLTTRFYLIVASLATLTLLSGCPCELSLVESCPAKSQEINFNLKTTADLNETIVLKATATSDLPVSFKTTTSSICTITGSTLKFIATGTCTVIAEQAGDGRNYLAAISVTRDIKVTNA